MKKISRLLLLIIAALGVFSCENEKKGAGNKSVDYELVKIDSIRIDYLGEVRVGDFLDGKGMFYNGPKNEIILFDHQGKVLAKNSFPLEGPQALPDITGIKMFPSGQVYANTIRGEIGVLNQDLKLSGKIELPFPALLYSMKINAKILDIWRDQLFVYYPGRDGVSPYTEHYLKNNHLVEKVSLENGESVPFLKLSPRSIYQSELFYKQSSVIISVFNNTLYHVLDAEPMIHLYDLEKEGEWTESVAINPARFVQIEGQKKPVGYVSGNIMYSGSVSGVFPYQDGFVVSYREGIDQETFVNNQLNLKENFPRYPHFNKNILKVYHHKNGWSNEIEIMKEVKFILNIESPEKDFYALRNDDIIGEETDYLTVYRMRLIPKE